MITVYGALLSPFVRKVLMQLDHKGLDYEVEVVLPFNSDAEFRKISPLGKIPAFRDEHVTLSDSSVICSYVEQQYPEKSLQPADAVSRAKSLWFEELADSKLAEQVVGGIFFARLVGPRLAGIPVDEEKVAAAIAGFPKLFDYIEGELGDKDYLLGAEPVFGDFSVASMFLNARYGGYEPEADRWPKLDAWLQRMYAHDLMKKRIEEEAPMLAGFSR